MSDERRQSTWIITSTETIRSKVSFDESLTAEEAKKAYKRGDYNDIVDQDFINIESVDSAEPWGDPDDDEEPEEDD